MVRDYVYSVIDSCRSSPKDPVSSQPLVLWSNGTIKLKTSYRSLFGTFTSLMYNKLLVDHKKQCSTGKEAICSTLEQQSRYIHTSWRVQASRQKFRKLITKILKNGKPVLCSSDHRIRLLRPRKPLPLTTVELQKAGSRLLKMAPKKVLDVSCDVC